MMMMMIMISYHHNFPDKHFVPFPSFQGTMNPYCALWDNTIM